MVLLLQTFRRKSISFFRFFVELGKVFIQPRTALMRLNSLVFDDRTVAQESMLNDYPSLRAMYTTGPNGNTAVYYFKNATATISSFSHEPIVIKF